MARRRGQITSNFPGAATPIGSVVRFRGGGMRMVRGTVTSIRIRHADVTDEKGNEWSVPYAAITAVESAPTPECTLDEVAELAHRLVTENLAKGTLTGAWTFGFDLAPSRAGVCRYNERRIDLSVAYCMAATRVDIEDTILHEIAHAIVGPRHNHDKVWKAKAREIGCTGDRCHRVQHSVPKWVGECGCGQQWFRQTLQRRMMFNRACAKCHGEIRWRKNAGGGSTHVAVDECYQLCGATAATGGSGTVIGHAGAIMPPLPGMSAYWYGEFRPGTGVSPMKIGVSIPRLPDAEGIREFCQRAERLGFESVMAGDHIVLPVDGTNQYPYTPTGAFQRPSDEPFLETMTMLGFMAACTSEIRLGSTVLILPYRNPVVQAKMFASLDVLSSGRMICGVGVGWLEKEFDILGVSYADRGPMTDEFLAIFNALWTEEQPVVKGKYYQIDGIYFEPKPVQQPRIPIWVGGHTRRALRRTAKYGDCWHTTRQTPDFVAKNLPYLREQTELAGRDPADITISLKRSLHFTDMSGAEEGVGVRSGGALINTTQAVIDDVHYCNELGIDQLTFDFRVDGIGPCIEVMEHLAEHILPVAERLG